MNKLYLITFFAISTLASFTFGTKVGAVKNWVYTESLQAHSAMYDVRHKLIIIENLEACEAENERTNYLDIHEAIIAYGRYLNSWWSHIPVWGEIDDLTRRTYREPINFYLDNKYEKPDISPEEAARKTISEMLADGSLQEDESSYIYELLLNDLIQMESNFGAAVKAINQ